MKTLYIECNMGAAGDMLMAALLELHPDAEGFVNRMNHLNIPKITMKAQPSVKCGITGTHIQVLVDGEEEESADVMHPHQQDHSHECGHQHGHEHHHRCEHHHHHHTGIQEIEGIIEQLELPDQVKTDAKNVYRLIAQAESHAHNKPVTDVHFHEVGTMDAVADVVGVCWLLYELAPARILASDICVGSGQVRCAHGILPVPAPATAYILQNVPIYGGSIKGELCTPTGAALLKYFVDSFQEMPVMRLEKIGYGMGKKDFECANCVRAMLGDLTEVMDQIIELCCNLDDSTPETIGYATKLLLEEGALDVYTTNIQMKKNRPGVILTCMCRERDREKFLQLIFKHTTTLGIREYTCKRYGLERQSVMKDTEYGSVGMKISTGYGVIRKKYEYEDLAKIAEEQNVPISDVVFMIEQ